MTAEDYVQDFVDFLKTHRHHLEKAGYIEHRPTLESISRNGSSVIAIRYDTGKNNRPKDRSILFRLPLIYGESIISAITPFGGMNLRLTEDGLRNAYHVAFCPDFFDGSRKSPKIEVVINDLKDRLDLPETLGEKVKRLVGNVLHPSSKKTDAA